MGQRLAGKVAVITGGASGIGAGTARLFLEEGAAVMVADLAPPGDAALVAAMAMAGDRSGYIRTDVACETDVAAAIASAVDRWGKLDVAVACAGIGLFASATNTSEKEWDRVMNINAKGVFFVTKYAVPQMLLAGGGSIINISSVFGNVGALDCAAYCASKGAVRTFTKSVAIQHAKEGIRANSIHPGVIETPPLKRLIIEADDPEQIRAMLIAQQPNGYMGQPEDVGWGCVYLASDESRFVSGAELVIDYGMIAR